MMALGRVAGAAGERNRTRSRPTRAASPSSRTFGLVDKIDVVGSTRHPLYSYLATYPDPNGVGRLSLNFEKFLLDKDGRILRRYPRKFTAFDFEADINAATSGEQLPAPSAQFK